MSKADGWTVYSLPRQTLFFILPFEYNDVMFCSNIGNFTTNKRLFGDLPQQSVEVSSQLGQPRLGGEGFFLHRQPSFDRA